MDPKDIAKLITEDPDIPSSDLEEIRRILIGEYGDSPTLQKLLRPKSKYANPHQRHTGEIIKKELKSGLRLVGMPWKENVAKKSLRGLHVMDSGDALVVSLPENADVIDFMLSSKFPFRHLVNGLAFGYNPAEVLEFYNTHSEVYSYEDKLHELGVILSTDRTNDGYATVYSDGMLDIVVEPDDRHTVEKVIDKLGKLFAVIRSCPECDAYVRVPDNAIEDLEAEQRSNKVVFNKKTKCPHKPVQDLSKSSNDRHWFVYKIRVNKQ